MFWATSLTAEVFAVEFQALGSFWTLFPRPRALCGSLGQTAGAAAAAHLTGGQPPLGKLEPEDSNNNLASRCWAALPWFLHFLKFAFSAITGWLRAMGLQVAVK